MTYKTINDVSTNEDIQSEQTKDLFLKPSGPGIQIWFMKDMLKDSVFKTVYPDIQNLKSTHANLGMIKGSSNLSLIQKALQEKVYSPKGEASSLLGSKIGLSHKSMNKGDILIVRGSAYVYTGGLGGKQFLHLEEMKDKGIKL